MKPERTDDEPSPPWVAPKTDEITLVLRLTFLSPEGVTCYTERYLNNLIEVSVSTLTTHKEKYLGIIQLEGYPTFPRTKKSINQLSKVERARQFAIAYIETSLLISARTLLDNVHELSRTDAAKALAQLAKEGRLVRVGLGVYAHPERANVANADIEIQRGKKGRRRSA